MVVGSMPRLGIGKNQQAQWWIDALMAVDTQQAKRDGLLQWPGYGCLRLPVPGYEAIEDGGLGSQ